MTNSSQVSLPFESFTRFPWAAKVFSRPYPHMAYENFWPEDFYRLLLSRRPEPANYVKLNREDTRRQFTLFDGSCDAGDDERRQLWKLVSDVLASPQLEEALRERLDEGLRLRVKGSGEPWPAPMYPRPVLYADYDGYAIKPHPDTRKKVLTMLIYMPEDDSQKALGTTIYKLSPKGVFHWKSYGLVEDKTLPFLPNSGLAFVVIHPRHICGTARQASAFFRHFILRERCGHMSGLSARSWTAGLDEIRDARG